jgi:hypothetical protein
MRICRQAVCVPVAGHLEESCVTHKVNRTINIPVNATTATVFASLGLQKETDRELLRDLDFSIERIIEETMQKKIVKFLNISTNQVTNVTVPNFIDYVRDQKNEKTNLRYGSRTFSPEETDLNSINFTRVEASFVLRRKAEFRNLSDSIVEMYEKLASAIVSEESFTFNADVVVVQVFGIWEEQSPGMFLQFSTTNLKFF